VAALLSGVDESGVPLLRVVIILTARTLGIRWRAPIIYTRIGDLISTSWGKFARRAVGEAELRRNICSDFRSRGGAIARCRLRAPDRELVACRFATTG
jgi:hypothetical protein